MIGGSYGENIFSSVKRLLCCFAKWLHHFVFLLAVHKIPVAPCLPQLLFDHALNFGYCNKYVVVSHYFNSQLPSDHFICLFVICISSLVRHLFIFFCPFMIRFLVFSLSFKSSLYILGNSFF